MSSSPELTLVGRYSRDLRASIERMHENVVDWEHLPWLHASTFSSISCLDAGPWGFRAEVGLRPSGEQILLELLFEPDASRWVSRTVDGRGAGGEIWSVATATGPRTCRVDVEIHLPEVRPATADRLGASYAELYARLYDEDESMMVGRQEFLDRACTGPRCPHRGGPLDLDAACDGVVTCPWHGYRFVVETGECLDDPRLRLAPSPPAPRHDRAVSAVDD